MTTTIDDIESALDNAIKMAARFTGDTIEFHEKGLMPIMHSLRNFPLDDLKRCLIRITLKLNQMDVIINNMNFRDKI